jgi:hypothetical protein
LTPFVVMWLLLSKLGIAGVMALMVGLQIIAVALFGIDACNQRAGERRWFAGSRRCRAVSKNPVGGISLHRSKAVFVDSYDFV